MRVVGLIVNVIRESVSAFGHRNGNRVVPEWTLFVSPFADAVQGMHFSRRRFKV